MHKEKPFGVSYASPRSPHKIVTECFDQLEEAKIAFIRAKLLPGAGEPTLIGNHKILESYSTKGGLVIALMRSPDGYFHTLLWTLTSNGLYEETLLCTESKRISERRIMDAFGAVCAAERGISAMRGRANVAA